MDISAGEFKAKCLKLMDQVALTHEEIVITKFGKPIAKLVALDERDSSYGFGCMEGSGTIVKDIVSSVDEKWDVEK